MKEIIQKHLEEERKKDRALLLSYNPVKIDGCMKYINSMAKKEYDKLSDKSEHCIGIESEKVYHWAREYFVDGICKAEVEEKQKAKLCSMSAAQKQKKIEQLQKLKGQQEFEF